MAAGDRIFMAKESTSQEILSNTKKIIEDAKAKPKRYGMRINLLDSNPATRVKYLYDAVGMTPAGMNFAGGGFDYGDWGDIWFVKKNRPVMVRTDGTVDYELNHENHALKLNGGASDITKTSYGGNAMSEIPLIWVKRWTQNNYHFVVFCEEQYDDTYKAYAHTDADGNVLPVTYFPMYEGSVVNNRMRSLSGLTPTASMTDEQETTAAKQNGDRWDKQSFSEINLMYEMCTMITCSTNSQGKFGNGNSQSDNFLQTGTLNGKGQFFGYTSTTQAVKVFYCENFFANYWKRLRGLLLINGVYHVKAVPPYNSTGAGYTNTGLTPSGTSGGYCSRMEMASDIGRIPTVASGSETTYECDGLWFNNTIVAVALFGGLRGSGSGCGLQTNPDGSVNTYDADGNKVGTVDAETVEKMTTFESDEDAAGQQEDAEDGGTASNDAETTNPPYEPETGENGANTEPQEAEDEPEDKVIIPQGKMKVTVICDGSLNIRRSAAWGNENICGRAIRGQSYYVKEIHVVDGKKMVRTIGDLYLSGESEHVQFEQL